jgi:hypothetical protein
MDELWRDQIIRKTDYIGWDKVDPERHDGIVTLVIELDPNRRRMKLGFSFCSPSDRFNRKEGHKYAHARLGYCPIEIPVLYQADHAAGEVLKALCIRDWKTLEQVTTLGIYTPAWRKAVPGWAKKWYNRHFLKEPMNPLERVVDALEDWRLQMVEDFGEAGAYAVSKCMNRIKTEMVDELKVITQQVMEPPGAMQAPQEVPKSKVH